MFGRRQNISILKTLFFSVFILVVTSVFSNSKIVHFEHDSNQNLISVSFSTNDVLSYQISPLHHGSEIPETPTDGTEQSQSEKETETEIEKDSDNDDDDDDFYRHLISNNPSISYSIKTQACFQKTGFNVSLPYYILFQSWKSFLV